MFTTHTATGGYCEHMDMQEIEKLMQEVHFPITKQQLVQEAEQKGMQEAKPLFEKLPEQTFGSAEEVMRKLPLGSMGQSLGL